MRDLVIVLPGIMGSVLRRDGQDLWNPGPGMARQLLRSRAWVDSLVLRGSDDATNVGPVDGVVPSGLAASTAIIPGLVEIDGYTELHQALVDAFGNDLIEGDPLAPTARVDGRDPGTFGHPNYYRFAYDWRRDLRASALRLHRLIDEALPNLRSQRSPDAKVVFVAHSMGGLLARYYIEGENPETGQPFDGWQHVRELFTMGTPYRGAVAAAGHLVEGYKKLFVDLSAALRSYTGVYQLLPRYRSILDDRAGSRSDRGGPNGAATWIYPHEMVGVSDFDPARAADAYNFHLAIEQGVERNRSNPDYPRTHCVPLLGFGHGTSNSARLTDDGIKMSDELPAYLDQALAGGDGTVPMVSAIPLEYDQQRSTLRYVNQQHGALQADRRVLAAEIIQRIRQLQTGSEAARNLGRGVDHHGVPTLNLEHLRFWVEGDSDGTEGGAAALGSAKPERLHLALDGVADGVTASVVVTDLDSGESTTTDRLESGSELALPSTAGDYRITAHCAAAQLSSTSMFSVLPDRPDGADRG